MILGSLLLALPFPVNGGPSFSTSPSATIAIADTANFVYVINTRQHFGDQPDSLPGTYRGEDHEWNFNLPDIDPNKVAVLMLQTREVSHACNVFQINGVQIPEALRAHTNGEEYVTEIGEIPAGTLKANGNTLRIVARNDACGAGGNLDDFIVVNVIILYRQ